MKEDYKLAALVHSQLVADFVYQEVLLQGWDIHVEVTSYDNAMQDAKRLIRHGFEVILCHGGFREELFIALGSSIVFIDRSDIDLLKSLREARREAKTVALTMHTKEAREIEFMEQLLSMHIIPVRYTSKSELEKKCTKLFSQGVHVFVGGGGTARIISRLGGEIFLDLPQSVSVRNALRRAILVAENIRMDRSYRENIQSIMQHSKEGMICINNQNEVIFHNDRALRLLQVPSVKRLPAFFRSLFMDDVLSEPKPHIDKIVTINNEQLLINTFPLQISSKVNGALCFIHDVHSLQNMQCKIGASLHKRGLVASYTVDDILGHAPLITKLKENILRYAVTDIPVFIHGETGTGKELVAHSLHAASKRAQQPFMVVNCAALPDQLLESELFGYEEGAFTGAKRGGKPGLFELANGGTFFLDEIGDISPAMQVRLLRVLDAKEVMHVGGDRFIPINVRIIGASNKQLVQLVQEGIFRADLYFRLTGIHLEIPPLRDRVDDIPDLIHHLLSRYNKDLSALSSDIRSILWSYAWPGNIRELLSVIESYFTLLGNKTVSRACFDEVFRHRDIVHSAIQTTPVAAEKMSHGCDELQVPVEKETSQNFDDLVADFRKDLVRKELARQMGNQKKAAAALGISYSNFRRILGQN